MRREQREIIQQYQQELEDRNSRYVNRLLQQHEDEEDRKLVDDRQHQAQKGPKHRLMKIPHQEHQPIFICSKSLQGRGHCYSGMINTERDSPFMGRYKCVESWCTYRLCVSCGHFYGRGKKIQDILSLKRPSNKQLWAARHDGAKQTVVALADNQYWAILESV